MRRATLVLTVLLSMIVFGLFQPAMASERGVLFKVSHGGHTMHLFGTLHVGKSSFYPLEPRIRNALANATTLALEVDPFAPSAGMRRAVAEFGQLAPGEPGYERLAEDERRRIERIAMAAGIDAGQAFRYKPVLLASLLALHEFTRQGYRIDHGADRHLAAQVRHGGARLLALESLDAQLRMLDRLQDDGRWRFLVETLDTIESGAQAAQALAMARAWERADRAALDAIAQRMLAGETESGAFVRDVIFRERNTALAEGLMRLLQKESNTVAALGFLHLLGEGGVAELLAERGAEVERLY